MYGMTRGAYAQPSKHQRKTNFILIYQLTPILRLAHAGTNFILYVDLFYLRHLAGTAIAETRVTEEGSCNN
jgi:hypothetical protein